MKVVHFLTAYREDDILAQSWAVPEDRLPQAKVIANMASTDPEAIDSHPLTFAQARAIAHLIDKAAEVSRDLAFFLEPADIAAYT
jgi:hypothetical protein